MLARTFYLARLACLLLICGLFVGASSRAVAQLSGSVDKEFNACSLFSAGDAQSIMGAPMVPDPGTRPKNVCMYVEVTPKPNSIGPGRVTLTVNKHRTQDDADKDWANLKNIRRLKPGEKNIQSLSGIGDESWFDGHIEKGKIGVASVLARKGTADFMLDSMVLEYRASPDTLKAMAKRVADHL